MIQEDIINNPKHYGGLGNTYETIKIIEALGFNYLEGNIFKYLSRWKQKNGLEDLKKAQWYLNRLIDNYSSVKDSVPEKDNFNGVLNGVRSISTNPYNNINTGKPMIQTLKPENKVYQKKISNEDFGDLISLLMTEGENKRHNN